MNEPFWRKNLPSIVIGLLDVFSIGFGMGTAVFAIVLGFPVGWWLAGRTQWEQGLEPGEAMPPALLRSVLIQAAALTTVTFLVLAVIWGPYISTALDPTVRPSEWGIPTILYTPEASKVGWLVLMLVISPVLQFVAVVSAATARLARRAR